MFEADLTERIVPKEQTCPASSASATSPLCNVLFSVFPPLALQWQKSHHGMSRPCSRVDAPHQHIQAHVFIAQLGVLAPATVPEPARSARFRPFWDRKKQTDVFYF